MDNKKKPNERTAFTATNLAIGIGGITSALGVYQFFVYQLQSVRSIWEAFAVIPMLLTGIAICLAFLTPIVVTGSFGHDRLPQQLRDKLASPRPWETLDYFRMILYGKRWLCALLVGFLPLLPLELIYLISIQAQGATLPLMKNFPLHFSILLTITVGILAYCLIGSFLGYSFRVHFMDKRWSRIVAVTLVGLLNLSVLVTGYFLFTFMVFVEWQTLIGPWSVADPLNPNPLTLGEVRESLILAAMISFIVYIAVPALVGIMVVRNNGTHKKRAAS